jgi:hypothetical protein
MDDNARLRDAFAQLLAANGQGPTPSPIEALWAQQGNRQLSPFPTNDQRAMTPVDPAQDFTGQSTAPIMRAPPTDPTLNFPTAEASDSEGKRIPKKEKPFGGKGEVVGPYELPKAKKKGKG